MTPILRLVRPHIQYKDSVLEALRSFQAEGLAWYLSLDLEEVEKNFAGYVQNLRAKESLRTEALVPETELWGVVDEIYVGRLSIRHELNEGLRKIGGHIGYDIVQSFRGRGYASHMLAQALPIAQGLGIKKALLTCDASNMASSRVIEKNGGILHETKILDPQKPPKCYYWIDLDEQAGRS